MIILACIPIALQAQIKGEGDIVKEEIQLETLTGVALGFSGDVVLTQGSTQKIVMEGQKNVLDNIKRTVKNGMWHISFDKNVRDHKPVKVYITMATLKDVAVSGSGNISTTNVFKGLGDVDVAVSGSGGIDVQMEAQDVESAISGSGDVRLSGKASTLELAISGSGDFDCQDLRTDNCEIAISGSGDAKVHCTGTLEVAISGSGDVRYVGDTPKVRASVSGSGDVLPMD